MAPSPHQGLWGAFARQFQLAPNARLPCHSSLPSCLADPAAPQNLPRANGACFRRPSVLRTKVIPAGAYAGDGGARQSFASPDFRRARQKDAHRLTRARPSHGLPRPERWAKRPAHRRQPPPDRRASPQPRDAARDVVAQQVRSHPACWRAMLVLARGRARLTSGIRPLMTFS